MSELAHHSALFKENIKPKMTEGVVTQRCNPLTLQPEWSGGVQYLVGPHHLSVMTRGHRLDKRLATSVIPVPETENCNYTFTFTSP